MAAWTVMLSLFVASLATVNANDHKHSGIGFVASRGKRSIDDASASKNNDMVATGEPSISNLIVNDSDSTSVQDYMRNLPELSIFKRAPSGFMGMRGKKDDEYSDYSRRSDQIAALGGGGPNNLRLKMRLMKGGGPFPKRAPSGFMGMRGKKLLLAENNKRGPQGFMGMRGKKDIPDMEYSALDNEDLQLFQALQNEQDLLNDIKQIYVTGTEDYNKRAPSSAGFFGMRGKKLFEESSSYVDDDGDDGGDSIDKRAPSGFVGMRGKKFLDYPYEIFEEEKRAPMGFFGMRGKKDVSAQIEEQKRTSFAQFFGIRGKKQPLNSGFFGMRGKKQPMEFRGKFVGVRGKKAPSNSLRQLEEQLNDIENNDLRTSDDDESTVKRAPSGFMGMRGKKWPDTSSSDNQD